MNHFYAKRDDREGDNFNGDDNDYNNSDGLVVDSGGVVVSTRMKTLNYKENYKFLLISYYQTLVQKFYIPS